VRDGRSGIDVSTEKTSADRYAPAGRFGREVQVGRRSGSLNRPRRSLARLGRKPFGGNPSSGRRSSPCQGQRKTNPFSESVLSVRPGPSWIAVELVRPNSAESVRSGERGQTAPAWRPFDDHQTQSRPSSRHIESARSTRMPRSCHHDNAFSDFSGRTAPCLRKPPRQYTNGVPQWYTASRTEPGSCHGAVRRDLVGGGAPVYRPCTESIQVARGTPGGLRKRVSAPRAGRGDRACGARASRRAPHRSRAEGGGRAHATAGMADLLVVGGRDPASGA